MSPENHLTDMDKIVSLSRRRGFVFQSSEIYGGQGGCWDYGPLGVQLKNNIKQAWWQSIVQERDDVVGVDSSILMNPRVWEASGHVTGFSDPMSDCLQCKMRWRPEDFEGDVCPSCGGQLTEPRQFNLMFKTFMGPVEDSAAVVYLRPETAQGIFVNFENVLGTTRKKLPFGIAQIGKSFRNEITTGNFIFRSREFEQMELEYFVKPGTDDYWHQHWLQARLDWYTSFGIRPENLKLRAHCDTELAHYAKACSDIQYLFPMGWSELEGIANRCDFDLKQHSEYSGKKLEYFDEETRENIVPYVIEPSAGVDRSVLAFLIDAYTEEPDKDETRTVLKLHPRLAPFKAAVLPLSKKEPLANLSREIYASLRKAWMVTYDEAQSIGRRYRRQDEIGTPYCITVDFQSLEDNQVTVRERDSMTQVRIPIEEIKAYLFPRLKGELK
ncbi:glycyl-tRNA synthetase [Dehalogenimonas lykanthroporepellens BL-DC-9]|nr:glycyl-tRNA synthetase [Dehalogenimonas lykanthroporepellens BL-DC-9]